MWVNPLFELSAHPAAVGLMRENKLATLVVADPLRAAHMPLLVEERADKSLCLTGHVPLVDPLASALSDGARVLSIFSGASSYVSPDWYTNSGLPTYNFLTVHTQGQAEPMTSADDLRAHLMELMAVHEAENRFDDGQWVPDDAAISRMNELLPRVMGFRITVDTMQAKAKLGQNRNTDDQRAVAAKLNQSSISEDRTIARLMYESARKREEHQ